MIKILQYGILLNYQLSFPLQKPLNAEKTILKPIIKVFVI